MFARTHVRTHARLFTHTHTNNHANSHTRTRIYTPCTHIPARVSTHAHYRYVANKLCKTQNVSEVSMASQPFQQMFSKQLTENVTIITIS